MTAGLSPTSEFGTTSGLGPTSGFGTTRAAAQTPTGTASATPDEDSDHEDPWVRLDEAPAVLSPDATDTVTVTVTAGDTDIPAGWSVMLTMQPRLLVSRTAIASWRSGSLEGSVGQEVTRVPLTDAIPAGDEQRVTLPIDAAHKATLIDPAAPGVHGAAVLLLDDHNDTRRALTRTFLISGPTTQIAERPQVTVLLPLTSAELDPLTGLAARDSALAEIAGGGRLDQLRELGTRDGVVPVLDPTVLTLSPDPDAPPASPTAPTSTPVDAPLADWRTRAAQSFEGREVIALPYADPDLVALADAKAIDLAETSNALGAATLAEAGLTARQDIAVPISGEVGGGTLNLAAQLGRDAAVVLDASEQPPSRPSRATLDARGRVEVRGTQVPTLLTDPALSSALAATADTGPSGGAAAQQRIRADLVVLAGEAPSRHRHILVTAPRDFSPTAAGVAAVGQLVDSAQTRPGTLTELIAAEPIDRDEPTLNASELQSALPTAGVQQIEQTLADAAALASTFTEADGRERAERVAVTLVSSRWRTDHNLWESARSQFSESVNEVRRSVRVVQGSTVTQVSRNVRLPVTVENATDGDVAVRIDVEPSSKRLVVTEVVHLSVPAHSRAVGYIPVRGVGNGDTSVEIRLLAPSGVQLGDAVVTNVRVRADWETVGTRTIGVLAALVLLIGLVRSIRRGPRASRARDPLRAEHPDGHAGEPGQADAADTPRASESGDTR